MTLIRMQSSTAGELVIVLWYPSVPHTNLRTLAHLSLMPSADEVHHSKWSEKQVLFDDGEYSIISGLYDGNFCLGERWNGHAGTLGFPQAHFQPVWHVIPGFLQAQVLHGAIEEMANDAQLRARYLEVTLATLARIRRQN